MKIIDFPKAKKKLEEFCKRNLEAFQKNVMREAPKDILETPDISGEMVEKYTESILLTQQRMLYDFFDENRVFINVMFSEGDFYWNITLETSEPGNESREYSLRIEAENEAFEEAFKIMEEQL